MLVLGERSNEADSVEAFAFVFVGVKPSEGAGETPRRERDHPQATIDQDRRILPTDNGVQ